jgi:hypothetical protein
VTSINAIKVQKKKPRRFTDHFQEDQFSSSDSDEEMPEQEGSSTSDDSQETSIDLAETNANAEAQFKLLSEMLINSG